MRLPISARPRSARTTRSNDPLPRAIADPGPRAAIRDVALLGRLQAYKREVAGAYRSLPPGEMLTLLPPGPCLASEKLDGETWFLHREGDVTTLLSPAGKAITGIPVTDEAGAVLESWSGLLAGELYAVRRLLRLDPRPTPFAPNFLRRTGFCLT